MPFLRSSDFHELLIVLDIAQESVEENTTTWKLINRALIILKTNND